MSNIYARSPYIIEVNETGQTRSKIEIYIWNTGSVPASPTYTLSKSIPSSNNLQTLYNVSPYIREYISHATYVSNYNTNTQTTPTAEFCNVQIKRYKIVVGVETLLDTTDYFGFDGYTLYEDGSNYDLGNYHIDTDTYSYPYDSDITLTDPEGQFYQGGIFTAYLENGFDVKYTNLVSGASFTNNIASDDWYDLYRVYPPYYADGNLVEILDAGAVVLHSFTMKSKCVPKYIPVACDFVNRYGAWQRTWFFAASNDTLSVKNTEYNLLQESLPSYDTQEGQRKIFNVNGTKKIKVNTDWVKESYKNVIQDLMFTERILINNKPAKINTKSTELFKGINKGTINYQLEFEFAYNSINSVI
jgi:hypothetical protein